MKESEVGEGKREIPAGPTMKLRSEKEKRFHPQGIEPSRAEEADETVPKRLLELRGGRRD